MKPVPPAPPRVNLRTPDVMSHVQAQVESHYRSALVEKIRSGGGVLRVGETTIRLAKQFGFCYGVERAIDLAYAAGKVFSDRRIFLLGEIIHNPDVNAQMSALGILTLPPRPSAAELEQLDASDVVIVPAFGAEVKTVQQIRDRGCQVVDTTCGDVMSVWKRVRQNAAEQVTSIIHGKATHEETRATASRALGADGSGHYLIVLDLDQTRLVCRFLEDGGDSAEFLTHFEGAASPGFDPLVHLQRVGVANQTTMLRKETETIQALLREAIARRDGGSTSNFRYFDTICGATQERQDALFQLLEAPLDLLIVIGGYNSSNTTHLVEIGVKNHPTWFVRNAGCLISAQEIRHYDLHSKSEILSSDWLPATRPLTIGVTAGASCPNNLIEECIRRVLELRGEEIAG
ncbi:MAG: 4-hydroxy-3-methylbut-2-enyl diphosphate reductase [Verrucomicrobia bacterium]|nr:4-hydroxy-3-methylbut-2-enyl diphosphate reductase [Verrucomicrobiota bacterium]